jgi:mRNA interferase MazF
MTQEPSRTATPVSRGQIYWLSPDDDRGAVPPVAHPHVIVQDDVFNRSRIPTVVVCALTTNRARANEPGNILLEPGEGGLEKRSIVVVSQLSVVAKSSLGDCAGLLAPHRVDQILEGLRFQQAGFLPH